VNVPSTGSGSRDWAIVLAGGDGMRLREITGGVPKQFCRVGEQSLLRLALARAARVVPAERTLVVVADPHRRWWQRELAAHPAGNVVVQPANRGTSAGVLLPLLALLERDADARVALLPSDHFVRDEARLAGVLGDALAESAGGRVVLLGIEPEWAAPDYGWILPGDTGGASAPVTAFVEKPGLEGARDCFARGGLWNSFLIAARALALLDLFRRAAPELVAALERACVRPRARSAALARLYPGLAPGDFSRDVLQASATRLQVRAVPPCGWTDLGTPERMARCLGELELRAPSPQRRARSRLVRASNPSADPTSSSQPPAPRNGQSMDGCRAPLKRHWLEPKTGARR
jgi:mannose-1-phosphate guanylyltransferase